MLHKPNGCNGKVKWRCLSVFALLAFVVLGNAPVTLQAQSVDLLLKGGHVIDPKNGIDSPMDVAIKDDQVYRVAENISEMEADRVVDVSGLFVTPGLIDLHFHVTGRVGVEPDGHTFRSGVTTVVDGGSTGWRYANRLLEVAENSQTRVLGMIDIVGSKGEPDGDHGSHMRAHMVSDMDPLLTAYKVMEHPDVIVGIKSWKGPPYTPIERAVEAGDLADVPVMVDLGSHDPPLSLEKVLMEILRPGDIFTHPYSFQDGQPRPAIMGCESERCGREEVVDEDNQVKPFLFEAQEKGIVFDVAHGGGSFIWHQVIPSIEQGLLPTTISTDFHTGSMNAGMKDMVNVMSKFLNVGMSLEQVIGRSTWQPARVIGRKDLGHLSEGAVADIAVFRLHEGEFGFIDARGRNLTGSEKLETELTIRDGRVVWDLNGRTVPMWYEEPLRY